MEMGKGSKDGERWQGGTEKGIKMWNVPVPIYHSEYIHCASQIYAIKVFFCFITIQNKIQ